MNEQQVKSVAEAVDLGVDLLECAELGVDDAFKLDPFPSRFDVIHAILHAFSRGILSDSADDEEIVRLVREDRSKRKGLEK